MNVKAFDFVMRALIQTKRTNKAAKFAKYKEKY